MSHTPFTPAELGLDDTSLTGVADELERYADLTSRGASPSLIASIVAAVDAEPAPRRGLWAALVAPGGALRQSLAMAAVAGVVVAAIGIGFLAGQIAGGPTPGFGGSPVPSEAVGTPSPAPSAPLGPKLVGTPSATRSASPSPSTSPPTSEPATNPLPSPTASDDLGGGNSGPGGGDRTPDPSDDSSGSGSGRGGSGSSGSGSGSDEPDGSD